ncbi:hypothetical protein BD414DRAFT_495816 [Trametes punicea]|nr:hypothetical protein BD414DRAFT_495816 [Trametes punicea]
MPRLGSESNSSVRRHNAIQTLSNYVQLNSQVWQIRSTGAPRSDPQTRADESTSQPQPVSDPQLDVLDDILNRTRATGSRNRWNARSFGSPYGQRPLHKWLPSEQKHFEELSALMEMFPEPGLEDDFPEEKDLHEIVFDELEADEEEEEAHEDRTEVEDAEESDEEEADNTGPPQPPAQPQSSAVSAAKKRERNKRKKAKARAKAKEKMKPPSPDPVPDAPQDLLMSMSRIAKLVGSLNAESPDESNELLQRVRDAFTEEGRRQLGSLPQANPGQWRAEVLQSVRRMESMLGQMEKWHAQVAPGEIEALRAETARLEVRVRAVVEQKERERAEVRAAVQTKQPAALQARKVSNGPVKIDDEVEVEVAEAAVSSDSGESVGLDGGGLLQSGAEGQEDDSANVSDSVLESNSCPSETDTGQTDLRTEERSPPGDKGLQIDPPPLARESPHTAPTIATPTPTTLLTSAFAQVNEIQHPPHSPSSATAPRSIRTTSVTAASPPTSLLPPAPPTLGNPTLLTSNHNIPPEPPTDPVEHLKKNPWSMIEVLFLLEVVSHFPPAEHGWVFIAEAYNNILITRPLQEWFGKQAAVSNEEEAKMKSLLQQMNAEARQIRVRRVTAKARAAAHARGKQPANSAMDEDAVIVTRLPYPITTPGKALHPADNPANAPPAQRIAPFPRRRPPFTLASEDARAFSRVMASATAVARPPSEESRAAMLALYAATKSRFPVRTAWDCWHRWCTPWIVQDGVSGDVGLDKDQSPIVLDYIAGNLCLPAGTWVLQPRGFVYRPIPGTYPDVPGVQRKVTGGFDPRPGMVAYARMVHLQAEETWAGMGLKRKPDGTVPEDVLVERRTKLPGTLLGIWPVKGVVVLIVNIYMYRVLMSIRRRDDSSWGPTRCRRNLRGSRSQSSREPGSCLRAACYSARST